MGAGRSDVKTNPLPLGAGWGATVALPDTVKEKSAVFGLTVARPCTVTVDCGELTYDPELQMALQGLQGPWDGSILPRMQTSSLTSSTGEALRSFAWT